jgi:hypothetical protein
MYYVQITKNDLKCVSRNGVQRLEVVTRTACAEPPRNPHFLPITTIVAFLASIQGQAAEITTEY